MQVDKNIGGGSTEHGNECANDNETSVLDTGRGEGEVLQATHICGG